MRIYWVSHVRTDCEETYEFYAIYPTEEERDYHLKVLLLDGEAFKIQHGDYERKDS